jgi:hypothetical protein
MEDLENENDYLRETVGRLLCRLEEHEGRVAERERRRDEELEMMRAKMDRMERIEQGRMEREVG